MPVPVLTLHTHIKALPEICFHLSRSVDLHAISTAETGETAIAGVTAGLMDLGDSVTWRAKHLGVWHTLTSKITEMETPHFFVDEMQQGIFKKFRHEHRFVPTETGTLLIDRFDYTAPLGVLGKLVDFLFLKNYMARFLCLRNETIRQYAESEKWKEFVVSGAPSGFPGAQTGMNNV